MPRRNLSALDPLPANRARLKRVERALAQRDAFDVGHGPEAQGLPLARLEGLRGMLVRMLVAKQAAARLDAWLRRNWTAPSRDRRGLPALHN